MLSKLATKLHRTVSLTTYLRNTALPSPLCRPRPSERESPKGNHPSCMFCSPFPPHSHTQRGRKSDFIFTIASLLRPDIFRMLPTWSAGSGDLHVQRCS